MIGIPTFPELDGLMKLSRREGIDIRPTLLRVLTDLYVQTDRHTAEEERQFIELSSRLIEQVDEPTRAMVRARLAKYAQTPDSIAQRLSVTSAAEAAPVETATAEPYSDAFFAASREDRLAMLQTIADAPAKPSMRPTDIRATRALIALEAAAFAGDREGFAAEIASVLMLSAPVAARVVSDEGGEALACAAKALAMPSDVFQRVLMFLDRERGASVERVYRLSRLYDALPITAARSMITSWRSASFTQARVRHQGTLHDDERARARGTGGERAAPRSIVDTSRRARDLRG